MAIITTYTAVTTINAADRYLTSDSTGATKLTTAQKIKDYVLSAGAVTASKIDFGGAGTGIWWEEIGRAEVVSGQLAISGLPNRKYLKVFVIVTNTGATAFDNFFQFNSDTSALYRATYAPIGGASTDTGSTSSIPLESSTVQQNGISMTELDIVNIQTLAKVCKWNNSNNTPTSAVTYLYGGGRWVNTTSVISSIQIVKSAGAYGAGTEIIVLGHN